MLNAVNGSVCLEDFDMDYIRFGSGERVLVVLPGVGDGLKTVKGMALPFAVMYRSLAKKFTVYMFSRRVRLDPSMGTREMAGDLSRAMEALGITKAAVVGISQGGMIAQWLAIDHPELVDRLVLVVTIARPNPVIRDAIRTWQEMARRGDYKGIMVDTAERAYSEKRLKTARILYSLLGNVGKPKSFRRFRIQARSCIKHDAYDELGRISCPVLVIGGTDDRIADGQASVEIAERIPGSRLKMYDGLGHGLYEEAPDFWEEVAAFCE